MKAYKKITDNELARLLNEADHAAYNEIYNRYFHVLYVHAYKKLRDEEQSKDVVQDLFATLWFRRGRWLANDNLAGYLFTAVRNRVFDLFARRQVEAKYTDSLKDYLETHSGAPADHLAREHDLSKYINRAVAKLPAKMRRIFEMSRKENLSHREIAGQLGVSENNVSKQVNNALRLLKAKLG